MPNRCRLRLVMDGRLESVERAGIAVREFGLAAGLDAIAASDLELATVEAANNIVLHGFAEAKDANYRVVILLRDGEVQVILGDSGLAIPVAALAEERPWDSHSVSSRGIALMRACSDRLEYWRRRDRNRLLLGKRLPL